MSIMRLAPINTTAAVNPQHLQRNHLLTPTQQQTQQKTPTQHCTHTQHPTLHNNPSFIDSGAKLFKLVVLLTFGSNEQTKLSETWDE